MAVETELEAPVFLIAVPQLSDPNFARGVIFVLEHGEEGSMGLLLNRTSHLVMDAFCASQHMRFRGDGSALIHQGGPVQPDRAFILHSSHHHGPETEHVVGDIKLSYSLESLKLLSDDPPPLMRVFLGYTSWSSGQLAAEVAGGAWLLSQPSEKIVFQTPPEKIWEQALRELGIEPVQLVHSGAMH